MFMPDFERKNLLEIKDIDLSSLHTTTKIKNNVENIILFDGINAYADPLAEIEKFNKIMRDYALYITELIWDIRIVFRQTEYEQFVLSVLYFGKPGLYKKHVPIIRYSYYAKQQLQGKK